MREIGDVLALALVRNDPGIDRHVRDRIVAGDEGAIGDALVEHAVEPVDLVAVAVHGVGNLLHRVIAEVIVLTGHGTEIAHLPEQPLDGVDARARIARQELPRLLGEIEQHGAGFEHRDRLAAAGRCAIDQRGNAVVRGDGEEFRLELLALADVHRHEVVGQPGLLEEDRDLVAVRMFTGMRL